MFARIPPHIFWPGMVVGILLLSVGANVVLVVKARSDGGAQIIEDYYSKAAHYDEGQAKAAKSKALHWTHEVTVAPSEQPNVGTVRVVLRDTAGPLEDLGVQLTLRDPAKIAVVASAQATHEGGGVYVIPVPLQRHGLWDVDILATQGSTTFEERVRVESKP
jgi:nitrogen fixation protein FixH